MPQQPPMAYYSGPTGGTPAGLQPAPGMTVPPPQQHHVPPPAAVMNAAAAAAVAPTVATVNGAVHPEDVLPPQQQQPVTAMISATHNAHIAMAQQQHQVN